MPTETFVHRSRAAANRAVSRFTVTYNAAPGAYYDTTGRYGVTDSENPGMGNFYSGLSESQARRIARALNARA
jgi:hypothetical protein